MNRSSGFTKFTRETGIKVHKGYKKGLGFLPDYKEYKKVDGIRPDYFDGQTIFELKPFNPRSAKAGIRQLRRYQGILGKDKIMRLEFY